MREAEVKRKTNETDISCQVVLDSTDFSLYNVM